MQHLIFRNTTSISGSEMLLQCQMAAVATVISIGDQISGYITIPNYIAKAENTNRRKLQPQL